MIVEDKPMSSAVDVSSAHSISVLEQLDNSGLSKFHFKAMLTSGMGFFTDAYDLFIIGVALSILTPLWHLNTFEISIIGSSSLIAAALGSLIFGRIADFIGRKSVYSLTLIVLAAGAVASAFSPNLIWLLIFRFILGLGIGGDYPLSATLMSEYANRKDRGKLITMVFSMQGVGLVIAPLIAIFLLSTQLPADMIWRIMLGLGAVPALGTFYLRHQIAETPRFALAMSGDAAAAAQTIKSVTGTATTKGKPAKAQAQSKKVAQPKRKSWFYLLLTPRYLRWLIGTAGTWFLLDIAYYGTTISSPLVLKLLNPKADLKTNTIYTLLIFLIAAVPGYIIAALTIDRLGRRWIQCVGFAITAIAYLVLAFVPGISILVVPFLLVYGVSYFFTEFGANVTTFVYPAEIFPVMIRSTAHGISAASGKVGAFIGALVFPLVLARFGLPGAMLIAGIVSAAGLVLTFFTLPEPKGRSLEEISEEHTLLAVKPLTPADRI
ncbi:MFS transporter [Dictyobacter arantiisoli]|uniref:MFS transporter n=1 Tax=Dictyobacter arantiisoli TaxID=2014874 RepID=A0A5A5THI4_9CHLR|nr:MFS transporter [Dictyobacter arantiisoli]GCF10523.1 MFS transporter [Dictyobacter arantiisoli]